MAPSDAPLSFGGRVTLIVPTALVWALTPLSWVLVPYHHLVLSDSQRVAWTSRYWYLFLLYHAYLDVPFSVFLFWLTKKAQRPKELVHPGPNEMRRIFLECLEVGAKLKERQVGIRKPRTTKTSLTKEEVDEMGAEVMRLKFRQWFRGRPPLSEIYRANAIEWIAWAVADARPEDVVSGSEADILINEGIEWMQHRLHHDFTPGRNPKVESIRLTMDPVRAAHRPVGYYIVCNSVTLLTYAWLLTNGCRYERYGECAYITRGARPDKRSKTSAGLPILFVHGLGIGLGQYLDFLRRFLAQPQPIMILIQPNISTQIFHRHFLHPPSKDEHVASFKAICAAKGYTECTILSHSNGTMVHAWLLRGAKELCRRNVLADAVSFCLWQGDVCYSFLHQPWRETMEVLLGYFVARELGTAHTICRNFIWSDMLLMERDLPRTDPASLQIILAEHDFLVDADAVVAYLHESGISDDCITCVKGAQHGAALIVHEEGMKKVLASL
ncbi:BQ5605_C008g05187 [Microbotryum silenes-dioicae]|uniref:BQ5605_C008g05187 protein n=1 Tax=Microbotryum silenes-dioicae TaxID=796604 RepID=A0A2X0N6C2_9BASI|nr:BQ5605_C008g05187 [Microbotryum silenes-dioicae]